MNKSADPKSMDLILCVLFPDHPVHNPFWAAHSQNLGKELSYYAPLLFSLIYGEKGSYY